MARRRVYVRDRFGRFASGSRGGVTVTAVATGRGTHRKGSKKLITKSSLTLREYSGALRQAGHGRARSGKSIRQLALGAGTRRRGQTARMVSRVNKVVIVPTAKVRRSKPIRLRSPRSRRRT